MARSKPEAGIETPAEEIFSPQAQAIEGLDKPEAVDRGMTPGAPEDDPAEDGDESTANSAEKRRPLPLPTPPIP